MTDLTHSTGEAVRAMRRARNLSQREIGEAVGRSQQWVAAVEAGRISITFDQAVKIARRCSRPVGALVALPNEQAS
jgi:transcriptional regulator with XRE-family HTH domain